MRNRRQCKENHGGHGKGGCCGGHKHEGHGHKEHGKGGCCGGKGHQNKENKGCGCGNH